MTPKRLTILGVIIAVSGATWVPVAREGVSVPLLAHLTSVAALAGAGSLLSYQPQSGVGLRLSAFGQAVEIGMLLLLGAVWPSLFTLVALATLPAFVAATIALLWPGILRRMLWDRYVTASVVVAAICLSVEGLWLTSTAG